MNIKYFDWSQNLSLIAEEKDYILSKIKNAEKSFCYLLPHLHFNPEIRKLALKEVLEQNPAIETVEGGYGETKLIW